jgi:hypothetical protein
METVNVKIIPDDANKIIKREIASLSLALAVSILIVIVQRKVSDPDFVLTCRMRTFNGIARYADTRASFWRQISDKATRLYLETRP